ncbi:hypothetical protein Sjap_017717 [Stephania japonica]|uniref:Uncharacterized protein n=1 Tax=Stephania japonica TaxID=461633 RepID=A0AAP0NIJ9_9MAGN
MVHRGEVSRMRSLYREKNGISIAAAASMGSSFERESPIVLFSFFLLKSPIVLAGMDCEEKIINAVAGDVSGD